MNARRLLAHKNPVVFLAREDDDATGNALQESLPDGGAHLHGDRSVIDLICKVCRATLTWVLQNKGGNWGYVRCSLVFQSQISSVFFFKLSIMRI